MLVRKNVTSTLIALLSECITVHYITVLQCYSVTVLRTYTVDPVCIFLLVYACIVHMYA